MPFFQSTYYSKVFRDFKEIDQAAYRDIVRFYEEKEEQILRLDWQEYFEMLVTYVDALFQMGSYNKHLLMVDIIIEASIRRNMTYYRGRDLFRDMLFRKAASFYNCLEYEKADYILRELIRMNPKDEESILFLKKCLRKMRPGLIRRTQAAGIFLFLLTAVVIFMEVLLVRPFYEMHAGLVELSRNSIFSLGCAVIAGGYMLHRYRMNMEVDRFVECTGRGKRN